MSSAQEAIVQLDPGLLCKPGKAAGASKGHSQGNRGLEPKPCQKHSEQPTTFGLSRPPKLLLSEGDAFSLDTVEVSVSGGIFSREWPQSNVNILQRCCSPCGRFSSREGLNHL